MERILRRPTPSTIEYLTQKFRAKLHNLRSVLLHPVFIFVVLQIVSVALTVIWVIWYVNKTNVSYFDRGLDLMFLVSGCIFSGIIIVGTVLLFIFAIKQSSLYKQQRRFVSSVTHELRSPIASMQLSLETMKARKLDQDVTDKMTGMALSDLSRLVNLVNQILVSARLDRGINIFNQVKTFKIREAIDEALANESHADANLSQRIKLNCPDDIEMRTAQPALRMIIENLIGNAVKYSPKETEIKIEVEQWNDDIHIRVIDAGFGLEKRELRRIFRIFQRGELAERKAIPGTGLGLYIVKTVVKNLGGRIWVESEGLGAGATFNVTLPRVHII